VSVSTETSIVVITAAVAVAPILADSVHRWIAVPNVVIELVLGVLVGPVVVIFPLTALKMLP
jgi:Kef-type K+ transport system membrane component KefB